MNNHCIIIFNRDNCVFKLIIIINFLKNVAIVSFKAYVLKTFYVNWIYLYTEYTIHAAHKVYTGPWYLLNWEGFIPASPTLKLYVKFTNMDNIFSILNKYLYIFIIWFVAYICYSIQVYLFICLFLYNKIRLLEIYKIYETTRQ